METASGSFNLHSTLEAVGQAVQAILCHMLFDFAIHGLCLAVILTSLGIYLLNHKHPYSASIRIVAKRITIFCLVLIVPGSISLIVNHKLPDAGVFSFNSIGLLCFWSLICTHLVAEEINNSLVKAKGSKTTDNKIAQCSASVDTENSTVGKMSN